MVDQSKGRGLRTVKGQPLITDFDGTAQRHTEPEIEVTRDDMAAFWGAYDSQWVATFGAYDLDCLCGYGRTPLDAIVDLLDQAE